MFQRKVAQEVRTCILVQQLFFENRIIYDNAEKCGRGRQPTDDNTVMRMRFECWITKATDTQSEYIIQRLVLFDGNNV
jgi:hypothetical protein